MPSFAFWKSAKQDETKLSLLNNDSLAEKAEEVKLIVPKNLDLDPGNEDSGVFLFDDEEEPKPTDPEKAEITPTSEATLTTLPASQTPIKTEELQLSPVKQVATIRLLDREDPVPQLSVPCLPPDVSSTELKTSQRIETANNAESNNDLEHAVEQLPSSPRSTSNTLPTGIITTQLSASEEVVESNKIDQEVVLPQSSSVGSISVTQPSAVTEEIESDAADQENLLPQSSMSSESTSKDQSSVTTNIADVAPPANMAVSQQSHPVSLSSTDFARPASVVSDNVSIDSNTEDSGVYLSENEDISSRSRNSSITSSDNTQSRSRPSSFSLRNSPSARPSPSHQRTGSASSSRNRTDSTSHRLCRPAELNLGSNTAADGSKPKSELEKRHDLIRNSKNQSKAALRSPTDLLKDRLNMSPKKVEEKIRIFTPPKPLVNGCLLPGPGAKMEAFTSASVRAQTEIAGRPAWWCKFDKLVVFDGVETLGNGEMKIHTRTSKGLTIARRRGDIETIIIPMDCQHCQEMLNRHEWKYDMRVCKRSVCWDCKERCKWEVEQEKEAVVKNGMQGVEQKADANRYRADSMLQDEHQ